MKWFKLTKVKRLVLMGLALLAAIFTIIFGSIYYVGKNGKKSIEYGGGAEYLVQLDTGGSTTPASIATDTADEIYNRINPLGVNGATAEAEISGDQANIRVTVPGEFSQKQREEFERVITTKPQLVLTDFYGNPIFTPSGRFNSILSGDPGGWASRTISLSQFYSYDPNNPRRLETRVPIAPNGAHARIKQDGSRYVSIELESDRVALAWSQATQYISSLPEGKNRIYAWLDPQVMFYKLNNFYAGDSQFGKMWANANNPSLGLGSMAYVLDEQGKPSATMWSHVIDAHNYLVSSAVVSQQLTGRNFIIEGTFTAPETQDLARKINFGISDYSLKTLYANNISAEYGNTAFLKAMIAGIVVFAIITIVLLLNYGLLGALATISLALFVFMTLALFTVMRGEYSPASIAALIIGVGMSVDAIIITFERLKSEVYAGSGIKKAFKNSNRASLSTIFDSNLTTLIVAVVLFYFGTRSIIGMSITLILSIIFTMVIMVLFTRVVATLLVNSGVFHEKRWLIGRNEKFDKGVQAKIDKVDYVKSSRWFIIASLSFMALGVLIFVIFASINNSFGGGFELSRDFKGGASISILPKAGTFTTNEINDITQSLVNHNHVDPGIISADKNSIHFTTNFAGWEKTDFAHTVLAFQINISKTTTDVAHALVRDAMIAVAIAAAAVILYTFIRFKWTYSIAAIVALMHDALFVVFAFIIFRVEISPIFVAALLSIIGYSINDTIVTFDRVRERMDTHIGNLNRDKIRSLANQAVRETLKRSLLTSITTIIAVIVLMSFGNATKLEFNLAMLIGLISGTYSSIFIATSIWTRLELRRQNAIKSRTDKDFWKIKDKEEQTIQGINEYRS